MEVAGRRWVVRFAPTNEFLSVQSSAQSRLALLAGLMFTLLATGFAYDAGRRRAQGRLVAELLPHVRDIRRVGSAALDLCMVAAGRVDAHFEHGLNPWDWAAGALIAREAGARVHLPAADTRSAAGEVVIAMAPGIADELEAVFAAVGVFAPLP